MEIDDFIDEPASAWKYEEGPVAGMHFGAYVEGGRVPMDSYSLGEANDDGSVDLYRVTNDDEPALIGVFITDEEATRFWNNLIGDEEDDDGE